MVWIGVQLEIQPDRDIASIPSEKRADLLELIETHLRSNVISTKDLRSLAGKTMSIASLIFFWRPFLSSFWAALALEDTNAPDNCVWTKQVSQTLYWLRAFLRAEKGHIERVFTIDAFFNRVVSLEVTTDASPWGIGGWVSLDGKPISWFSDRISETDAS